ncbi:MAG: ABC transporter permease [Alphaproteobacteria bacterium]|nr:ABC transporter permease [Alphaproteobacteria bacterium]
MSRAALWIGGGLSAGVVAMALVASVWTPYPPTRMNMRARFQPPGGEWWLGTDHFGRDIASMILAGASTSLMVALAAVAVGMLIGVSLGCLAAVRRGWLDDLVMRCNDVVFAFPAVLSALVLAAVIGAGAHTAILAIGVFNIPVFARVARGAALQVWAREFVTAARAAGRGPLAITLVHIVPNIAGVLVVQGTIQLALAMLAEAGLSFLGVGIQPPTPSWGRMLADAQTYLERAPHLALVPGLVIALAVLGLNLLGDGLRDVLDPKLRRAR